MLIHWLFLAAAVLGVDAAPASSHLGPVRGRWVLDASGAAVKARQFEKGLQTSGLAFFRGKLWSVGDQRGEYPGQLLIIDPQTARLAGPPLRLELGSSVTPSPLVEEYRGIRNADFEGLTVHPRKPDSLFAVTEDKQQLVVEIQVEAGDAPPRAVIRQITGLEFADAVGPYRNDSNYRIEGIAASQVSPILYLAYERQKDNLPRIYQLTLEEAARGGAVRPAEVAIDFAAVKPRESKPRALLNLNDLQTLVQGDRELLLAVARDQERILVIDPRAGAVTRVIDVDFLGPDGENILWVSPEGLAIEPAAGGGGGKVWIINDPDSIGGNYRRLEDKEAGGKFADMAPVLFELPLAEILGAAAR